MKWQLLHNACWVGDAEEVARLLEAGANPNQVAPTDWRQTPLGRTLEFPITSPRHAGHVETVRILLRRGADPTVRSTYLDMTPYELATFCGLEPAAELLRYFRPATLHPTGMTDLWLASASRLPEPAKLKAVRLLTQEHDVNTSWRHATPLGADTSPANSGSKANTTAPINTARAAVHCNLPNRRVAIADNGKVRSVTDDMR